MDVTSWLRKSSWRNNILGKNDNSKTVAKAEFILAFPLPLPQQVSFEDLTGLVEENAIILIFSKMSMPKQICMLCVTKVPFSSFLGKSIAFYNAGNFLKTHTFVDDSKVSVLLTIHICLLLQEPCNTVI